MKTSIRWQARRGAPNTSLQDCVAAAADLGSRAHVQKVLLKVFSGSLVTADGTSWSKGTFQLTTHIDQSERPLFVDFHIESEVEDEATLLELLSPRLRRLSEDHSWSVFEGRSGLRLDLSPPKPRPRRKKGLVSLPLDPTKLREELGARSVHDFLVGGIADVAALDAFIRKVPPPDQLRGMEVTVGWDNLEVIAPDSTRYFSLHFGGKDASAIADWYATSAQSLGLAIASPAGALLHISGPLGRSVVEVSSCSGIMHNIWEWSLKSSTETAAPHEA